MKKNAEFHSSAYTKQMQKLGKLLNYYQADKLEAGCDEAGRGCYAGPVFAAAVILPKDFYHPLINDSKKLSEKQRAALAPIIKEAAIAVV